MKLSVFTRIGGKYNVRERIVKFFPPEYKTYVEPFLGGGQVFLEVSGDPNKKYVVNDKLKDIYDIWKDLKDVNPEQMRSFDWSGSKEKFNKLRDSSPKTPEERLYRNLYLSYYSMGGTRKSYTRKDTVRGQRFLSNIEKLQEIMKNVVVLNKDYKDVIKKYDSKDTLFYLDPPYTEKGHLYEGQSVDPKELAEVCRKIKGKFVLSYDISEAVKEAFQGFDFYRIKLPYTTGEKKSKYEFIITNFGKTEGGRIERILFEVDRNPEFEELLKRDKKGIKNLERFLNLKE